MRKIRITAGQCGAVIDAEAEAVDDRHVKVKITKYCEHVERMKPALETEPLDSYRLMGNMESSLIYKEASRHLPHVTCPVPSGIHKLIECEMGMAVPYDVKIEFKEE